MYIYMYTYIYICIYTCIDEYICIFIYIPTFIYLHVHQYTEKDVLIYTRCLTANPTRMTNTLSYAYFFVCARVRRGSRRGSGSGAGESA